MSADQPAPPEPQRLPGGEVAAGAVAEQGAHVGAAAQDVDLKAGSAGVVGSSETTQALAQLGQAEARGQKGDLGQAVFTARFGGTDDPLLQAQRLFDVTRAGRRHRQQEQRRLIAGLKERGMYENTLILFMSDNGGMGVGDNSPLRGKKSSVWEGGIRMPCLMRWPGVFRPGLETAQVTLMMDISASVLHAAKTKIPKLDGIDLRAAWQSKSAVTPRTVFWRYRRAENTRKAARDGDWKLVNDNGTEELHNLADDPGEQRNQLAAQPGIADGLRRKLDQWERDVRAPRLAPRELR